MEGATSSITHSTGTIPVKEPMHRFHVNQPHRPAQWLKLKILAELELRISAMARQKGGADQRDRDENAALKNAQQHSCCKIEMKLFSNPMRLESSH